MKAYTEVKTELQMKVGHRNKENVGVEGEMDW